MDVMADLLDAMASAKSTENTRKRTLQRSGRYLERSTKPTSHTESTETALLRPALKRTEFSKTIRNESEVQNGNIIRHHG